MTDAERPFVREYIVSDFDLQNVVYQGPDATAALEAWDSVQFPICYVNEYKTYQLQLDRVRDRIMTEKAPNVQD